MSDMVNHPSHYNQNGVETIDIIQEGMNKENYLGFLLGNIVKYLDRYQFKNGEEDLKKAQWYAKRMEHDLPLERTHTSYITELVDGNFQNAVKLWEEFRDELSKKL